MSSNEAWIWYGHLQLPDNSSPSNYRNPGPGVSGLDNPSFTSATNPNNFYASQWVLGREAILLRQADTTGNIFDHGNPTASQAYINVNASSGSINLLTPLFFFDIECRRLQNLCESRFDLADTSIDNYLSRLNSCLSTSAASNNWWGELFCGGIQPRFQANPFVTKPINPSTLSQQAPVFLTGCTQFIVEFAGDFVTQSTDPTQPLYNGANGSVGSFVPLPIGTVAQSKLNPSDPAATANPAADQPDGTIDFIYNPVTGTKTIRWYGLPRDTTGTNSIPSMDTAGTRNNNSLYNVVPVRDVIKTAGGTYNASTYVGAHYEKFGWSQGSGHTLNHLSSNPILRMPTNATSDYVGSMGENEYYMCAFGPTDPKPQMIRITMTLDDPSGTLPDGVTFQYVFTLP